MNTTLRSTLRKYNSVLFVNLLIISRLLSQQSVCPVGIPIAMNPGQEDKTTSFVRDIMAPNNIKWSNLTNVKLADDSKATVSLGTTKRARAIVGNNFKFQIPSGATIHGITVIVEGQSSNAAILDELIVQLTGKDGELVGQNKANTIPLQKPWTADSTGNDRMWMYGSAIDTWQHLWTSEEINSTDFGYMIQLRNKHTGNLDIAIDQIRIIVDYTPIYTVCDDKCLTFYIDPLERMGRYEWKVPAGFVLASRDNKMQTIDLRHTTAPYGLHEICVDVYDQDGAFSETCCREFHFQDCTSSRIEGIAWLDYNGDQLRDLNEGFIPNVSFVLFNKNNQPVDTVITNSMGKYSFENLPAGEFYIKAPNLTDHLLLKSNGIDSDRDSDVTDANGPRTTPIILTEIGKTVFNIDFGYAPLISIGDFVWLDQNYDGLQSVGEPGIPGIKVILCNEAGMRLDSVNTISTGNYVFANIPANKYQIKFVQNGQDLIPTFRNNSAPASNSDIDANGKTQLYTFLTAGPKFDVDAGYFVPASVSGLAWEDKNGDGQFQTQEAKLPNVEITLKGTTGAGQNVTKNTMTDANGAYTFIDLAPGSYSMEWTLPNNYHWTLTNQGVDNTDNDVNANGEVEVFNLISGDNLENVYGGAYRYGSVGDLVWEDMNGNGTQDIGDQGITGVSVTLYKGANLISSTLTDFNGRYSFDSLAPGDYRLEYLISDDDYISTAANVGDDNFDSDIESGIADGVMVMSGVDMNNIDAGYVKLSSLGDLIWHDINANGLQDTGETGISGIQLTLSGTTGAGQSVSRTVSTDINGNYMFSDMVPGIYSVALSSLGDYKITYKDQGTEDAIDNDFNDAGQFSDLTLTSGTDDLNLDGGLYKFGTVGNFVWEDINANGRQDVGEPGLGNFNITLIGMTGNGSVASLPTTTDASGAYSFNQVIPGNYKIIVDGPYISTAANIGDDNGDSDIIDSESPPFGVTSGIVDNSIDAGYYQYGSIEGFAWNDKNGDGLKSVDEAGKSVLVTLTGIDGLGNQVTRMTISNDNGSFTFEDLLPGNYTLVFPDVVGHKFTISNAGDDLIDSDILNNQIDGIIIESGDKLSGYGAGYLKAISIGDFAWNDLNIDGKQDVGEPGLPQVSVRLVGIDVTGVPYDVTQVTNNGGLYIFTDVFPGDYLMKVSLPDGFIPTLHLQGNLEIDNNLDPIAGDIVVDVATDSDILNFDLGFVKTGAIGDLVWEDSDCDGVFDITESGLAGVEVLLSGTTFYNSTVSRSTVTDQNGNYTFPDLAPGVYAVNAVAPTEYFVGQVTTSNIIMSNATINNDVDIPLFRKGSIGDQVWLDANEDGIFNTDEVGIAGVTVSLTSQNLTPTIALQTTTDNTGKYIFNELKPGNYNITFVTPLNHEPTLTDQGDDTTDSDINNVGLVANIVITSGQNNADIDAGYIPTNKASLSGIVWEDVNADGVYQDNEPGLSNVVVELLDANNNFITSTITGQDGAYSFSSLLGGEYRVRVVTGNTLFVTDPNVGNDDTDSDIEISNATTQLINVPVNTNVIDIDGGLYKSASIGDQVWLDTNEDGIYQTTESGIAGVVINIVSQNLIPQVSLQTITDNNGNYIFNGLKPGIYNVSFATPLNHEPTLADQGSDSTDSDISNSGNVDLVGVTSGQNRTDVDAGYIPSNKASIRGIVWDDLNADGVRDSGEPGISNILVELLDNSGSVISTTNTATDGTYNFSSLLAGEYIVRVINGTQYNVTRQNVGSDLTDSDIAPGTSGTDIINVLTNTNIANVDAGLYKFGSIGDFVWQDLNRDGIQQIDETGVSGVLVTLIGVSDPLFNQQIITDGNGKYSFTGLLPALYRVQFGIPAGQGVTISGAGFDRALDSDVNGTGLSATITINSGDVRTDVDAGFVSQTDGGLFGNVWEDKDADGQFILTEAPLSGVTIELYSVDGGGQRTLVSSTTTSVNGDYSFSGLAGGQYILVTKAPSNYIFTSANVGNDLTDSDFTAIGESDIITLTTNQLVQDIDAGLYRLASLGDYVWFDADKNGHQSPDENGVEGIVFTLLNSVGNVVKRDTSDADGAYFFGDLIPGVYSVTATVPDGYIPTLYNNGDPLTNSDFLYNGTIAYIESLMLMSGQQENNIDLGFILSISSISGEVWDDTTLDGIKDLNEPRISSVQVFLINMSGDTVQIVATDQEGKYRFDGVAPGNYRIGFENLAGKFITLPNVGSIQTDSDAEGFDSRITGMINVISSSNVVNIDCGFVAASSVGDYTWLDLNGNGLQDGVEAGQNGIKVVLLNKQGVRIDSIFTDMHPVTGEAGYYTFSNIPYGEYSIIFELPVNFSYTIMNASDLTANSDVMNFGTGATDIFTLTPTQQRTDIDAGFNVMNSMDGMISGVVWRDINGDRLRQASDELLAGKPVYLYDVNNTLINSAVTDANGYYEFLNLNFGDYYLRIDKNPVQVYVPYGGMPVPNDSDISGDFGLGTTRVITVFPGGTVADVDLGIANTISIGDYVWEDINVDGLQDALEPAISGVVVILTNTNNVVIARDTTDINGRYLFSGVPTGFYRLTFLPEDDYTPTFQEISQPSLNSDIEADGRTVFLNFTASQVYNDIDAGYLRFGKIGDIVWLDLNGNGFRQAGEPGVGEIKVFLFNESGEIIDSTFTSTDTSSLGRYFFEKVAPGRYYIKYIIPDTFMVSEPGFGSEEFDSNITDAFGEFTTDIIVLGSGEIVSNVDAGIYIPSTIGDRVWIDLDGDGIQDIGESGMPAVEVYLYAQNGQFITFTTTDANGNYKFEGLRQRLYFLQFSLPENFEFTLQNQGNEGSEDSDVDESGTTPLISIAHGVKFLEIDAGLKSTTAKIISGTVWYDQDEDGLRDHDEITVEGIDISLLNQGGNVVASTKTNFAGSYSFNRPDGIYSVFVKAPNQHIFTIKGAQEFGLKNSDINDAGYSDNFNIAAGHTRIDAGIYKSTTARLEGYTWFDKNNNSIQDGVDSMMADVLVLLFDQQHNFIKSTSTDINGRYFFTQILPGKYYIRTQQINDFDWVLFTGNNQDKDSEITNQFGPGTTRLLTMVAGGVYGKFDIGFKSSTFRIVEQETEDRVSPITFDIYPNPVYWDLQIDNNSGRVVSYQLMNAYNKVIQSGMVPVDGIKIDMSQYNSGIYYFQMVQDDKVVTKPIIKVDNK